MKASKAEIKLTKKSLDRANKVINEKRHHRSSGQVQHYKGMFLDKKKKECLKLKETIKGLEINLKALSEEKGKEKFLEKMNRLETENQDQVCIT